MTTEVVATRLLSTGSFNAEILGSRNVGRLRFQHQLRSGRPSPLDSGSRPHPRARAVLKYETTFLPISVPISLSVAEESIAAPASAVDPTTVKASTQSQEISICCESRIDPHAPWNHGQLIHSSLQLLLKFRSALIWKRRFKRHLQFDPPGILGSAHPGENANASCIGKLQFKEERGHAFATNPSTS